ncbi:MAG: chromosome segregation protein SMC [Acidobacteria bacterium]|nr:chromosome segregation protein SMC [Acidobacteriota bacterium]
MLKLRKIELLGFKSFCEKTAITFSGTGITCRPNGCGKSNIVDAMSWVLGEQSHKSLRAERMSDCIFNGTQKRPPMGMSEVMITLVDPELAEAAKFVLEGKEEKEVEEAEEAEENTSSETATAASGSEVGEVEEVKEVEDQKDRKPFQRRREPKPLMNMKPGEVVVGRRLYRSGQSEYLINGRVARLRDVQELFMGTGLGPESYAIIEQGRIGQVLSSKPTDRRGIIEEAAGVTKYKTKRRLAEAKLESSKLNLARVNDIVVEIEKQLASLKRQASKARRYAELREQMRGLLRQLLGSKARELDVEAERLENLLREAALTEQQESETLRALESEQERLSARNYELETELRQNQNLLGQTALELDRAENRIGFNRERMKELEARGQQLGLEIEQSARQAGELEARLESHRQSVTAARAERESLEAALEELVNRAANFSAESQAGELRLEELRVSVARLSNELTKLHGEQTHAEGSLEHHGEARGRVEQAEQQIRAEWAQYQERAQVATAEWQNAEAEARQLEKSVKNWQTRIIGLRHEQHTTSTYYDRMREQLAGIRARKESLEQILVERSYTADAVQKLFAANGESEQRSFRAVGVLADYAEVQEQYEGAVEQYLREELEYVVVETFDHARAGIQMLRDEVGGRATFFVDSLKKLNLPAMEAAMPFQPEQGVVSRLDQVVEFRDPLGHAAKQFLPRLRSAFLVDSPAAAEKLAREYPQYQFVTTDGTCYSGRLVSGGRPGEAGPLAIKREMRALETQAQQFEHDADEAQATLRRVEEELRGAEKSLEETIARHMQAEKALVAAAHTRDQSLAETARLERQLADYGSELARLRSEMESARRRAALAREQHESAVRARAADEVEMSQITERLAALRAEMQSHQEDLGARRAELAAASERLASAEMIENHLAEEWREAREREASQRQQQAGVARERGELEANTAEQQRQMESLAAEKARLEVRKGQLEQEWEQARTRAVEVDDALRMTRQKLGDLREQRSQHEIARARNDSDRQHLRETCLAELNQHPEDLLAQELQILTGEELTAADTNYHEMKTKLDAMGPVNMMALEEYQECEQRYTFLSRERDDLVQSITDTQQTIKELDEVSRQKFEEAFVVINKNFAECFRTLFGGGTGEMRLTEPDSSGDTGIDVVAQPPGKRLQNVLLLSGGEKAMTALALLIAIFRYQPSPFCILDEVDAPLDETNVGRFTKLIGEMSGQTQFLIVTHNKRTMEMAEVLYGVTMQEPGVSKLVSVRWEGEDASTEPRARTATAA